MFLYTKGTPGNPPETLQSLLRYMEDSKLENASNEDLLALHKMVTEVKHDREVGSAYMKSFEIEQRVRAEGRAEGRAEERINTEQERKRAEKAEERVEALEKRIQELEEIIQSSKNG